MAPTLDFEIAGDTTNCVDVQKKILEATCQITKSKVKSLDYDMTDATQGDKSMFADIASLSSHTDCTITRKGIKKLI